MSEHPISFVDLNDERYKLQEVVFFYREEIARLKQRVDALEAIVLNRDNEQ
jgi:hypothetical protein